MLKKSKWPLCNFLVLAFLFITEGLDGVNWQVTNCQNFNRHLTNSLKFYWQLTKDLIVTSTKLVLKTTLFFRQWDQMCVFRGHFSSKTLKCHMFLMIYCKNPCVSCTICKWPMISLLCQNAKNMMLLIRALQKQMYVLPRWFRYGLFCSLFRSKSH